MLRGALLIVSLALALVFFNSDPSSRLPLHVDGIVGKGFDRVREAFSANFVDGWERGGSSLVVYWRGQKVVDIWGGYADRSAMRKWKEDTISVVFSTTKGVSAVAVAILVDRGYLTYEDLVIKHWPEFGQHGKGNVTVQMMLAHMAGLPYIDGVVSVAEARGHEEIGRRLAAQKPAWPPGQETGYHVYTYGWLVDQLVRRVEPNKRGVAQFVREELADKYAIDFWIGLPPSEAHRVARLTAPTMTERLSEIMTDYKVLRYLEAAVKLTYDSHVSRALGNLPWLDSLHRMTVNNPDYHSIELPAALGIGNARSLAQIFNLAKTVIGHTGHGCQHVQLDRVNRVVIAYTTNALKTGLGDRCRTYSRLQSAVYDVLETMPELMKEKRKK